MRQMTTIYLDDIHLKYFKEHKDESMSCVVRQLLNRYIERRINGKS